MQNNQKVAHETIMWLGNFPIVDKIWTATAPNRLRSPPDGKNMQKSSQKYQPIVRLLFILISLMMYDLWFYDILL